MVIPKSGVGISGGSSVRMVRRPPGAGGPSFNPPPLFAAGAPIAGAEPVGGPGPGASSEDIARTCHAHPTLSETLREAVLVLDGRALYI